MPLLGFPGRLSTFRARGYSYFTFGQERRKGNPVPCKMRILPDTRDLINLTEHSLPVAPEVFGEYLRAHDHEIVLSFTNIRELSGPLARSGDFLQIRRLLQALEAMPHTYLKEVPIVALEIQSAVQAFSTGTEYQSCWVYVTRWDRTLMMLPGQVRSAYDDIVGLRLDDIVHDVWRIRPQVFAPPIEHLPRLILQLEEDRKALRGGKAPAREHFTRSVKKHATRHRVPLPDGREDELARWI